jgi:hypothetical protein
MPVQIRLNTTLGDTIVTLFNDAQIQTYQFDVIGDPQSVIFDPGNWILKNNTIVTSLEDLTFPAQFSLEQNYPNPFNPTTVISYQTPVNGNVILKVYDVLGNEVAILVNGQVEAGKHKIDYDASGLNSGVYFYKIEIGSFADTKKMILIK